MPRCNTDTDPNCHANRDTHSHSYGDPNTFATCNTSTATDSKASPDPTAVGRNVLKPVVEAQSP